MGFPPPAGPSRPGPAGASGVQVGPAICGFGASIARQAPDVPGPAAGCGRDGGGSIGGKGRAGGLSRVSAAGRSAPAGPVRRAGG
ncbi:hypothetical protein [Catenuloplanes nepalensis]|uniref:hypothetical protein n=1 Tax=Catenuloplanes nepalensis TaxID=587533 RepID=UPI0027D7BEE6|nr:hypothetical protein [Catenuloplanes nepalensis]